MGIPIAIVISDLSEHFSSCILAFGISKRSPQQLTEWEFFGGSVYLEVCGSRLLIQNVIPCDIIIETC